MSTIFQINDPSLESQWRAIILFGKWILRFDLCQSFRSDGASYYGSNDATLVV